MKRFEIPIHEVAQHKEKEAYFDKRLATEGFNVGRPITSTVDNKTGIFIFEQEDEAEENNVG